MKLYSSLFLAVQFAALPFFVSCGAEQAPNPNSRIASSDTVSTEKVKTVEAILSEDGTVKFKLLQSNGEQLTGNDMAKGLEYQIRRHWKLPDPTGKDSRVDLSEGMPLKKHQEKLRTLNFQIAEYIESDIVPEGKSRRGMDKLVEYTKKKGKYETILGAYEGRKIAENTKGYQRLVKRHKELTERLVETTDFDFFKEIDNYNVGLQHKINNLDLTIKNINNELEIARKNAIPVLDKYNKTYNTMNGKDLTVDEYMQKLPSSKNEVADYHRLKNRVKGKIAEIEYMKATAVNNQYRLEPETFNKLKAHLEGVSNSKISNNDVVDFVEGQLKFFADADLRKQIIADIPAAERPAFIKDMQDSIEQAYLIFMSMGGQKSAEMFGGAKQDLLKGDDLVKAIIANNEFINDMDTKYKKLIAALKNIDPTDGKALNTGDELTEAAAKGKKCFRTKDVRVNALCGVGVTVGALAVWKVFDWATEEEDINWTTGDGEPNQELEGYDYGY